MYRRDLQSGAVPAGVGSPFLFPGLKTLKGLDAAFKPIAGERNVRREDIDPQKLMELALKRADRIVSFLLWESR